MAVFLIVPLFLTLLLSTSSHCSIQCYKCTIAKPPLYSNETVRLCSDFDYSDKYIIDCPYSTYCAKRYFSAKIPAPINATERDCANQKYVTQTYKNGHWQPEIVMENPYQEGCSTVNDKGLRTSKQIDCYCDSNLCNKTNVWQSRNGLLTVILISLVNKL